MPDWNDPPEDGHGLFNKGKHSAIPADTEATKPVDGQTGQSWKLNRSQTQGASATSVPRAQAWLTPEEDGESRLSGPQLARFIWAALLITVTAGLSGVFVYLVFFSPQRLPLVHVVIGEYGPETLGRNPFDLQEREIWGPVTQQEVDKGIAILPIGRDQTGEAAARLLTEIAVNEDGLTRSIASKDRVVAGGGPSGKVRVWIISAIAAADVAGKGELMLLRPDNSQSPDSPPTTLSLTRQGVPLSRVLGQIADATPVKQMSVVLLDLRSPPVIMDFHNLAPAWESLVRKSLDAQAPNTDRLLVGIAAGDHEINWAAHELGAGVFTYFIEQAFRGKSDLNRDGTVTWDELTTYVTDEVQRWIARRRNSLQTPRWVIPPALQKSTPALELFAVTRSAEPGPQSRSSSRFDRSFLETQIGQLDGLWRRHAELDAYRDYPEQWGLIESNLILLHEMLERKSETNWSVLVRQVEESFAVLNRRRDEVVATSLHEGQASVRRIPDAVHGPWKRKLEAMHEAEEAEEAETAEEPLPAIAGDQLAWLCWTKATGRKSQSHEDPVAYDTQTTRLDRDTLVTLLDFYRQHRPASSMKNDVPWQELHLLRLLDSEVDWAGAELQGAKRDLEEAALDLCQCFDRIMEVSGRYGPQCHLWTDAELQELESEFLNALDELFAGRPLDAKALLSKLRPRLFDLVKRADELKKLFEMHTAAQYRLTHLLAWLVQGYLIADESEFTQYEDMLRRWRRTLELTEQCSRLRDSPQRKLLGDHPLLITGRELAGELKRLDVQWDDFVDRLAKGEESENNFRWLRIALKNPLTKYEQRQKLYDKMVQFLDHSIDQKRTTTGSLATDTTSEPTGRTMADVEKILWSQYAEVRSEADFLRSLYSGRFADLPGADSDRLTYYRQSLYRQAALAMGHRVAPAQRDEVRKELNQWQVEANCRYWETQGKRIVRMGLGNGFDPVSSINTDPYYQKAANRYLLAIERIGQRDPAAQVVAGAAESNLQALRESQAQYLQAIRLLWGAAKTFGSDEKRVVETVKIDAGVRNDSSPLKAALFVRAGRDVNSRIPFSVNGQDHRVIPRVLGSSPDVPSPDVPSPDVQVSIDTEPFQGNASSPVFGTLAFRGHHYVSELKYREAGQVPVHEISFVPTEKKPTQLEVNASLIKPPVVDMMILLDCSGSMDKLIEVEGGDKMLMEAAKEEAIQLLDRLEQLEREGLAHVNVGLILFGIGGPDNWHGKMMEKYSTTPAGKKLGLTVPKNAIVGTKSERISQGTWKADLVEFIGAKGEHYDKEAKIELKRPLLSPSGPTPLYLAIDRAFEHLGDQEGIQHVVVISDGVNSYKLNSGFTVQGLMRNLTQTHGFSGRDTGGDISRRLTILMFDNPPMEGWERKVYPQGMEDLRNLSQELPNQYKFFETKDFAKFSDELRNLIPPTKVVVSRLDAKSEVLGETELNESLELNLVGPGPSQLAVDVNGFLVQASRPKIPVYDGDQIGLTLSGDNRQRIEWSGRWPRPESEYSKPWENHVFTLAEPKRDTTGRRVDFLLDFEPRSADSFGMRPTELLCRVEQFRGTKSVGAFNVWDLDFEFQAGKNFPTLRLAELPWFDAPFQGIVNAAGNQGISARLTLWVANEKLPEATLVDIQPDKKERVQVGDTTFRISHRSNQVVVTAETAAKGIERANTVPGTQGCFDWIVRSSSMGKVTRRFAVDGSWAEHTLYLSDHAVGQQVDIELRSFQESTAKMTELTFPLRNTPR